jgi:FkbM family methyltransferase
MSTTRERVLEIISQHRPCTIIEIGAHEGVDTDAMWHAAGGECRYIAVEPDPRNAATFLARHSDKPIRFLQAAVSDKNGLQTFHGSEPYRGSGSLKIPRIHLEAFPYVKFPDRLDVVVPVVRLDEILWECLIDHVDVLWADVQGAEDKLLAGGAVALDNTHWFHTEFYDEQIYEGQIPLKEIQRRLPGNWELVSVHENDALFENLKFRTPEPAPEPDTQNPPP